MFCNKNRTLNEKSPVIKYSSNVTWNCDDVLKDG